MSELFEERNRLRAAVKAHHFDVAASKGIGVRASDRALYREAGLPDVGEADGETGAEFIARMERIVAERDRLRAAARDLVAAAKAWRSLMLTRPLPKDRERVVNAFADAIDAFDPMLSETTGPLDVSRVMGGGDG